MQAYRAIEDFDAAWQQVATGTPPPRLERVLQSIPQSERPVYLRELLAIDLEYRTKRGESPRVDDYVQRLAADAETVQSVFAECGIDCTCPAGSHESAGAGQGEGPQPASPEGYLSLKAGTEIGNYTIIRLIGQGGMGAVYQAEHRRMRRKVALKMISPAALKHPEALQRFHREAEAMARLEHPNIVTAHDADQAGDIHFLVMQYVDGEDLSTMVKNRGPLEVDAALRYLIQTALGLEYAHHEGVIHRDIKPSNLIVNKNGTVKILDMGLARLEDSLSEAAPDKHNLTQAGNLMGTVDYMAPEQALDAKEADQRADIYSLGCTFYYIVTGQKLYGGDTPMKRIMAHRFEPIPSLHAARPEAPAGLDPIFQKMVAKNRAERYQSMTELLAALAPFGISTLSGSDTGEHSPGHQSYSADLLHHRPAATSPSKTSGTHALAQDATAEQTSPTSISDTQIKARTGGKPVPVAGKAVARSDASGPHRAAAVPAAAHDTGTTSENVSWRSRTSKDAVSRRGGSAVATRRRLLGAVVGYVGVLTVLAAALYIVFGSSEKKEETPPDSGQPEMGELVIEAQDPDVSAVLADEKIRIKNVKTGEEIKCKPGSHSLEPGDYEIRFSALPAGITVDRKKFHIEPGGTQTLRATPSGNDAAP